MSEKSEKPKNKKIAKMSRNVLKKKARDLLSAGQLNSKYYQAILAELEGRPKRDHQD